MNPGRGTALFTDLYELTMAAGYHRQGHDHPASFEVFVRRLPPSRNFLVACGLEQALRYLEGWAFGPEDIDYLASLGRFGDEFLERLAAIRFTGEVWAMAEGTPVFPDEPLLRVTAPIIEAQLVETALLNIVGFQTMVASKAARVALACGETRFVDFSARRDHGPSAAISAARAAWISGGSGTSLVEAGRRFGLPLSGTMAHSYVMSFADETEAFRQFVREHPDDAVLLIDTYDTVEGARRAAAVANELSGEGAFLQAVRLDSGDLADLAPRVRRILDDAGLTDVGIFASGDLDEHRIAELRARGAPIDAWGVGTRLGTSGDAPWVDIVYKLVEDERGARIKLSPGKLTLPGRKQVHRLTGSDGAYLHDVLALEGEAVPDGTPLLEPVMVDGRVTVALPTLDEIRETCLTLVGRLPGRLRQLGPAGAPYAVRLTAGLEELVNRLRNAHG